jgi:hypothetical protein
MTKLKTLKDLEFGGLIKGHSNVDAVWLRKEAIKWWNEINFNRDRQDAVQLSDIELKSVLGWIEMFFNLTDKDIPI